MTVLLCSYSCSYGQHQPPPPKSCALVNNSGSLDVGLQSDKRSATGECFQISGSGQNVERTMTIQICGMGEPPPLPKKKKNIYNCSGLHNINLSVLETHQDAPCVSILLYFTVGRAFISAGVGMRLLFIFQTFSIIYPLFLLCSETLNHLAYEAS